ncbi:MAG: SIR2 family NAD-dependent protein deacylase [Promethearchaeota archaeon]
MANFNDDFNEKIAKAAELIINSRHLVFFTGAGISTESGIPDYRGPNGVWTRRDKGLPPPKPKVPWNKRKPNRGHYAITELQNMGYLKFLISQNVDNLHIMSGIKEELIAEFHGNMEIMRCLNCDSKFKKAEIWDDTKWGRGYRTYPIVPGQPTCPKCGGRIISSVVNFGDPIWEKELRESVQHSKSADVFIVVGSSLVVTPAAYMPKYALNNGAKLIIINKEETPFDEFAHIRFFESAGEVLTKIVQKVKELEKKG